MFTSRPSQVERNRPPVRFTVERWNVTATVEVGHESMGIYRLFGGMVGGWLELVLVAFCKMCCDFF